MRNKVNKIELVKKINKYMELLKAKKTAFDKAIEIIKTFEGKQVTKRIETKVKESIPEYIVYYKVGYVEHELNIWGNGIDYNNMINIRLCRNDSDKILKMEKVLEYPNWYDYQDHIDKLESFKKNINGYINEWNKLIDYMDEKEKEFSDIPYPASEDFYFRNLF